MKNFVFVLLLAFSPLLFTATLEESNARDNIKWKTNERLNWNDFKSKPPRSKNGMVAETQWSWDWEEFYVDGKEVIMPVCYFNPYGSWSSVDEDYILNHEQLHFDIGEVFVRKLRAVYLDDMSILNDSARLNKLFKKYFKMCVDEQRKYDKETNHSIYKKKQAQWEDQIEKDLNASGHLDIESIFK